jgi:hypothetical protein
MPIHPDNRDRYPAEWPEISKRIRTERAGDRCECRGQCGHDHRLEAGPTSGERCTARNREPHPVTTSTVVLTVAHLDHTPENVDEANLLALCQRCHLAYDRDHHAAERARRRNPVDLTSSSPLVLAGDCRDVLPTLPTASVDAVVTSPPYLKQRAYGQDTAHELGLEETVADYVRNLVGIELYADRPELLHKATTRKDSPS